MDDGRTWLLPIMILFLLLSSVTSAILSAITHLSDVTLHDKAEDGEKKAVELDRLLHQTHFLDNIRTMSSFFGCISVLTAGWWLYGTFFDWFKSLLPEWSLGALRLTTWLVSGAVISFFFVIFIRKLPGRIGKKYADSFAFQSVSFARKLTQIFLPFCWTIRVLSRWIGKPLGIEQERAGEQETVTEEDIRLMVDTGGEMGTIEKSQREMIENIFEFDENTAGDVMTHRTDIVALEKNANIGEAAALAVETGFSRLPVYEKNLDNITGVIYVKDFLTLLTGDNHADINTLPITPYIRPIIYLPESAGCRALFSRFKATKTHIAVVVDEYGGTAGIVCMEDILESIVGDIEDEYDEQEEEISRLKEDEYLLEGTIDLTDLSELIDIDFPEDEDYDTLGGFISHTLGFIPDEGTTPSIEYGGWKFTVVSIDDRRIEKVKALRLNPPAASETSNDIRKDKNED